jgi:hypothetical protein
LFPQRFFFATFASNMHKVWRSTKLPHLI